MYHYVSSCIIMYHHVSSSIFMYLHVSPCIFMYLHVSSCIFMYLHVSSCIFMYLHVSACISMYQHVSSCIIMYLYPLSTTVWSWFSHSNGWAWAVYPIFRAKNCHSSIGCAANSFRVVLELKRRINMYKPSFWGHSTYYWTSDGWLWSILSMTGTLASHQAV